MVAGYVGRLMLALISDADVHGGPWWWGSGSYGSLVGRGPDLPEERLLLWLAPPCRRPVASWQSCFLSGGHSNRIIQIVNAKANGPDWTALTPFLTAE